MGAKTKGLKLKDILNRNLVLFLVIQLFSDFNNNMASSFLNMGASAAGISLAAIGTAASVGSFAGWFFRLPGGKLTSSDKKRLVLTAVISIRAITIILMGTVGMTSGTAYAVTRGLYGAAWATCGVVVPSIAAMLMDRRVLGTTLAIYNAGSQLAKNLIKALGVYLYQEEGMLFAVLSASAFAVLAVVLLQFMDYKDQKLCARSEEKESNGIKGMIKQVDGRFLPICLVIAFTALTYNMHQNFDNVLAQEREIELVSILAVTGVVSSISSFALSALCDIIDSRYVLTFTFAMLGIGTLVIGQAYTFDIFFLGMVLSTIGLSYTKVMSVFLFKNCSRERKGAVYATNAIVTDLFTAVSGVLLGTMNQMLGSEQAYNFSAIFAFFTVVVLLTFGKRLTRSLKTEEE